MSLIVHVSVATECVSNDTIKQANRILQHRERERGGLILMCCVVMCGALCEIYVEYIYEPLGVRIHHCNRYVRRSN